MQSFLWLDGAIGHLMLCQAFHFISLPVRVDWFDQIYKTTNCIHMPTNIGCKGIQATNYTVACRYP